MFAANLEITEISNPNFERLRTSIKEGVDIVSPSMSVDLVNPKITDHFFRFWVAFYVTNGTIMSHFVA